MFGRKESSTIPILYKLQVGGSKFSTKLEASENSEDISSGTLQLSRLDCIQERAAIRYPYSMVSLDCHSRDITSGNTVPERAVGRGSVAYRDLAGTRSPTATTTPPQPTVQALYCTLYTVQYMRGIRCDFFIRHIQSVFISLCGTIKCDSFTNQVKK